MQSIKKNIKLFYFLIPALLLFPLVMVLAQEDGANTLDTYLRYMPASDAKSVSGSIEIIESAIAYAHELKIADQLPVKLSIDAQNTGIENTSEVEMPAHLTSLVTDIETTLPFFGVRDTYQRFGISPSFFGDQWNFDASDFRLPLRYLLIRRPNDRWTFFVGIAVYPDFERKVLPVLGFIYRPNEKLVFNIVPKGPNISYQFNDKLTLFVEEGGSLNSEFEVDKGDRENVVLQYKQARLGTGATFQVNQFLAASLSLGGVFNRSFKYRDSLGKVNLDKGFYSQIKIEAVF